MASCICQRRRQWQPTPVCLPGKSHGQRSLVGCSPWGHEESDPTEWLHFHFSLSCIEEGNGNSLQCSCLENPRDGGAWWAAVYGVAQSRTRLKGLSSSSMHLSNPIELYTTKTEFYYAKFYKWTKVSRKPNIKCRLWQMNLTILQINDSATLKGLRQNRNWSK